MSEMSAGASVPEQPKGATSGEQQNGAQVPGGPKKRRRGRRGGRNRNRTRTGGTNPAAANTDSTQAAPRVARAPKPATPEMELPDPPREGKMASAEAVNDALVRKPQIGDTRPAPAAALAKPVAGGASSQRSESSEDKPLRVVTMHQAQLSAPTPS